MVNRLLSLLHLRVRPLDLSHVSVSRELPDYAFFYDPETGTFIYDHTTIGNSHSEMLGKMGVIKKNSVGYFKGLDRMFRRGYVRGFYHTKGWEKDRPYIFLQSYDKALITKLCDQIVEEYPILMAAYDISKWGHPERIAEAGEKTVRELSSLKPSWVAMQRLRAKHENWPDPERYG